MGRVQFAGAWLVLAIAWALVVEAPLAQADGDVTPRLPQRAYVWQRVWTPALIQGLSSHARDFSALDFLAAEIAFDHSGPKVSYTFPEWKVVRSCERSVGLVVRLGPCRIRWEENSRETTAVLETCARVLEHARESGVRVAELQLDFDAATAGLREYRTLLEHVRRTLNGTKLSITVLPDWLRSAQFAALAREVDVYVLQVHSLEKPQSANQPFRLCDVEQAQKWIKAAAYLGRPFRIALPSYGYRLAYGSSGEFLGLEAEGGHRSWPAGTRLKTVRAEPREMARLVSAVIRNPPTACEGISWFRFPSDQDDLAWRWVTLAEVMKGVEPRPELGLEVRTSSDGSSDLVLVNRGTDEAQHSGFLVEWSGARLVAADGVVGWRIERRGATAVVLIPPSGVLADPVFPCECVKVGWLRFDSTAETRITPQ